jgi:hypothetical protein
MKTQRNLLSKPSFTIYGLLLVAPLLTVGCSSEKKVPVFPVSGKISYEGQVPAGAQVVLHPQGHTLPPDVVATGNVQPDGTFKIGVYDAADGAPAGDYVATVQWFKVVEQEGGGARGPNVIPEKYSKPDQSPLRISVKSGANEIPPVNITR